VLIKLGVASPLDHGRSTLVEKELGKFRRQWKIYLLRAG